MNNFKIGDFVSIYMWVGDLESYQKTLYGEVIQSDNEHITVLTKNNEKPYYDDIKYYIAIEDFEEFRVKKIRKVV